MNTGHRRISSAFALFALLGAGAIGPAAAHDVQTYPGFRDAAGWAHSDQDWGGEPSGDGLRRERFMAMMADRLELSVEQRAAIRDIFERARPELQALRAEQRANRRSLMDTAADAPGYDNLVQQVAEDNGRLTAERIRRHGQLRAEAHAVLTPEQRARARELREELRARIERRLAGGPDFIF